MKGECSLTAPRPPPIDYGGASPGTPHHGALLLTLGKGDQYPNLPRTERVSWDAEFSLPKLGRSQADRDELVTPPESSGFSPRRTSLIWLLPRPARTSHEWFSRSR